MKIALCYSGQLRNMRMMLDNHIEKLLIGLDKNIIDIYLYTDKYNTKRTRHNNISWSIENLNIELIDYFKSKLELFCNKITININNNCEYSENNYNQNMIGQLDKFYNVLSMINDNYDIVIRLRPDIYLESIDINKLNNDTLYQNRETKNNYNGDAIQIFSYKYLDLILKNTYDEINNLKCSITKESYETILNNIFIKSNLRLEWLDNLAYRWYSIYAVYFKEIQLKYFEDWINIEYKFNFSTEKLINLINLRKNTINILENNNNLLPDNNEIYAAALDADINNILYKDIIGLIPCSGSASRINGIPKFLLPCKEGNLINNTINLFKKNNINKIYISVSKENEHFIKPINEHDNDIKYIVKNTKTMSETVFNLVNIKSNKYILIMPDTYFLSQSNIFFKELTEMNFLLNKFDIVVILWKIKEYQYGKLGQINIDNNKVIDIIDKDINCRYPYSWGIIGWTNKVNNLIDITTPHIGFIINTALKLNIDVGYIISTSEYYDCGTPDEYFKMIKDCT